MGRGGARPPIRGMPPNRGRGAGPPNMRGAGPPNMRGGGPFAGQRPGTIPQTKSTLPEPEK